MKVVSSAKMSEKHQIDLINSFPEANFYFFDDINQALNELKDSNILITYGEDLTEEIIDSCEQLKWIQIISAGIDKIPFAKLEERGITVANARGIHATPMSEYIFATILQLARKTNEIYLNQLNKKWDRSIRVSEIKGRTLGILGLGAIGSEIARLGKAFGMNVIGMNSDGREVENVDVIYQPSDINELLNNSDYIVVVLPLTKDTYHFIAEEELKSIRNSSYLLNIGRGDVIDEQALIQALENNEIAGAVLDVFSEEPLPASHPFWTLDNCIVTPHLSGRSQMYMERSLEIFKYNMKLFQDGQPQLKNLIDLSKGY